MKKNKKRHPGVTIKFDENSEIAGLGVEDGNLIFSNSNGEIIHPSVVHIGDSYKRENGKLKLINQVKTKNDKIDLNPNTNLLKYDHLFVVDTNSRDFNNIKISISCAANFKIKLESVTLKNKQDWDASVEMLEAYIFRNPTVNPELVGLQKLITNIQAFFGRNKSVKIGIIVDSELSALKDYNQGLKPFLGEYFLPENYELIYASADVGKDYPHNKLMAICDKTANSVYKYLLQNREIIDNIKHIDNQFIDGYTIIPPDIVGKLSGYI